MNQSIKEKYKEVISHLNMGLSEKLTLNELCGVLNKHKDYFYNYKREGINVAHRKGIITDDEVNKFHDLYDELKGVNKQNQSKTHILPNSSENKPYGIAIRDENGIITHYEYCVSNRRGRMISGEISRDVMDEIYSNYTREGRNLTRRSVSRSVLLDLDVDFSTFQSILNVFKITKESIPVGLHIFEENSVSDLLDINMIQKENLFFKKIEQEKLKAVEKRNVELLVENNKLKNKLKSCKEWLENIDFSEIEPFIHNKIDISCDKALIIPISDLHIGSMVKESLYENEWNPAELSRRMSMILKRVAQLYSKFGRFDRIIVMNMGDALDGMGMKTTRGGHNLPQNLSDREQFTTYINVMRDFIAELWENDFSNHVDFYSVSEGNHDGVSGWMANRLLEEYFRVKYPNMAVEVFSKFIDFFIYGVHTVLATHGKDATHMFKNLPLTLTENLENRVNEYLDYTFNNDIWKQNVILLKGDLHQSATTYAKRFMYKSLPSVMGSSSWIQHNFGHTPPGIDFLILDKADKNGVFETGLRLD